MRRALASQQGGQRSKGTDMNQRERTRVARAALPSPADDRLVPEKPENSARTPLVLTNRIAWAQWCSETREGDAQSPCLGVSETELALSAVWGLHLH